MKSAKDRRSMIVRGPLGAFLAARARSQKQASKLTRKSAQNATQKGAQNDPKRGQKSGPKSNPQFCRVGAPSKHMFL